MKDKLLVFNDPEPDIEDLKDDWIRRLLVARRDGDGYQIAKLMEELPQLEKMDREK